MPDPKPRILFVDDEPALLDGIRRLLHRDYALAFAGSADDALAVIARDGPFAVVCADMRMPGRSGVDLLSDVAERHPGTVRLMLSGNADQATAVDAINRGRIFSFLNKPVTRERLVEAIDSALRMHALLESEKVLLERTLAGSVQTLIEILGASLPEQFGRAVRLRALARRFGPTLGGHAWRLEMAAMLAPIGWSTLAPETLEKIARRQSLGPEEEAQRRRVSEVSARLIANIPRLEPVAEVVRYAAKGFDGTGLPEDGRKGMALPVDARILRLLGAMLDACADGVDEAAALARLRYRAVEFDPALLAGLAAAIAPGGAVSDGPAATTIVEDLPLAELTLLHAGDVLLTDLLLADGTLALARGTVMTDILFAKLRHMAELRPFQLPVVVRRESPVAAAPLAA
jgi:response regulator RpfG family c-di-GMP phosphodiesterase